MVKCFNTEKRRNGGQKGSLDNHGFAEAILKTIAVLMNNYLNAEERCAEESEAFEGKVAKQQRSCPQGPARSRGAVTLQNPVTPFLCVKNKIAAWCSCLEWGCLRRFSFCGVASSAPLLLCVKNKIAVLMNYFNTEKRSNGGLKGSLDNHGFAEAILKTIAVAVERFNSDLRRLSLPLRRMKTAEGSHHSNHTQLEVIVFGWLLRSHFSLRSGNAPKKAKLSKGRLRSNSEAARKGPRESHNQIGVKNKIAVLMNNYLNAEEQRSRGAFTLQNSVTPFLCVKNKIAAWCSCFEWGCLRQFSFCGVASSAPLLLCVKNKSLLGKCCLNGEMVKWLNGEIVK